MDSVTTWENLPNKKPFFTKYIQSKQKSTESNIADEVLVPYTVGERTVEYPGTHITRTLNTATALFRPAPKMDSLLIQFV